MNLLIKSVMPPYSSILNAPSVIFTTTWKDYRLHKHSTGLGFISFFPAGEHGLMAQQQWVGGCLQLQKARKGQQKVGKHCLYLFSAAYGRQEFSHRLLVCSTKGKIFSLAFNYNLALRWLKLFSTDILQSNTEIKRCCVFHCRGVD